MKERIIELLSEIRPEIDFELENTLITGGLLASFDIVAIVDSLSDEYDVVIKPKDLIPENFDSVDAMLKLIERLSK